MSDSYPVAESNNAITSILPSQKGKAGSTLISRRTFLKRTAQAGGALLGAKVLSGAVGVAGRFLEQFDSEEGSFSTREKILFQLIENSKTKNDEQSNALLSSWLKFNAAEMKFAYDGQVLAADCLRHYLYGQGEPMDIVPKLEESIDRMGITVGGAVSPEKDSRSSREKFLDYIGLNISLRDNIRPTGDEYFPLHFRQGEEVLAMDRGRSTFVDFQVTAASRFAYNPDVENSLSRYQIRYAGNLKRGAAISSPESDNYFAERVPYAVDVPGIIEYPYIEGTLIGGGIDIRDRYDFSSKDAYFANLNRGPSAYQIALAMLGPKGVGYFNRVIYSLSDEMKTRFNEPIFDFHHHAEAAMLEEAMLAMPYDIYGNIELQEGEEIPIVLMPSHIE